MNISCFTSAVTDEERRQKVSFEYLVKVVSMNLTGFATYHPTQVLVECSRALRVYILLVTQR